jgi:hypothetical protein
MVKLKKNASKQSVDFLLKILNDSILEFKHTSEKSFFQTLIQNAFEQGVTFSEKELFIMNGSAHLY